MPVFMEGNPTSLLIDRTLPEVMRLNSSIKKEDLRRLCFMLGELGVDLLEIDHAVYTRLGVLPHGLKFIYRIKYVEDLAICARVDIAYGLLNYKGLANGLFLMEAVRRKMKVILEIEVDALSGLESLVEQLPKWEIIHAIRLLGLAWSLPDQWRDFFTSWKKDFHYKVDVCPVDEHKLATATLLELAASPANADYLTASFAGIGGGFGFAALEELLIALTIIKGAEINGKTEQLPHLTQLITKLTGFSPTEMKPVLGAKIFEYESGIHAAAIKKNPLTYEPFEPSLVGLKRKQVIGKHSGSQAVITKLTNLGETELKNINHVLEEIRAKSVDLGRALTDDEILELTATK